METEFGTVEDCNKCKGKGIIVVDLCGECAGTGKIETVQVIKTIKRPYGECKYPELKMNISSQKVLLTEIKGDKTDVNKGDFAERLKELVKIILDEENKAQNKASRNATATQIERIRAMMNVNIR